MKVFPASPSELFARGWRPYAWLILICYAVYVRTVYFHLTFFDDNLFLAKLAFLKDWRNVTACFSLGSDLKRFGGVYYRPLIALSFMFDAVRSRDFLGACHLTNVSLHFAASALFFTWLNELRRATSAAPLTNFMVAALFAAHPLCAQAVAWIPGRTEPLVAVFALASLICFLRYWEDRGTRWLLLHHAFFAAALFSKELAIIIPFVCAAYALLLGRRRASWSVYLNAIGWSASSALWYWLRAGALRHPEAYDVWRAAQSVVRCLPAILLYLGKIFFPFNLSPYPILLDASLIPGAVALGILMALALTRRIANPPLLAFGVCWFLLFLLPSFVYPDDSMVPVFFDYRAYLPMMGLVLALLAFSRPKFLGERRGPALAAILMMVFSALAVVFSEDYDGMERFFASAVKASPDSAIAHKQLGLAYLLRGELAQAESEEVRALALNPKEPMARVNLGVIHAAQRRYALAETDFQRELSLNPNSSRALFQLGELRYHQLRYEEAVELWRKAIQVDPDYSRPLEALAELYHRLGRPNEEHYYSKRADLAGASGWPEFH